MGGLGRIFRRPSIGGAVALGTGIAILANSRPYEGAFFCFPIAAVFLWWMAGKTRTPATWPDRFKKVVLPLSVLLLANFAFMGYYNWRLTGSVRTFPMSLNEKMYSPGTIFIWQTPKPPKQLNNAQFEAFYDKWWSRNYERTWSDLGTVRLQKVKSIVFTYFWWDLLMILPALYFVLKRRKLFMLWATFLLTIAAFFSLIWSLPHYVAPSICAMFAMIVTAMRHLRLFRPRRLAFGVLFSRLLVLGLVLQTANTVVTGAEDPHDLGGFRMTGRVAALRALQELPGKHLVIVRYSQHHSAHQEWAFNGADIESSKII